MSTLEKIAWDAWGLLSFIVLIVWLRWEGTWEDQKKDEPRERQAENSQSIHTFDYFLN
jgi:hypothetical protein